MKLLLLLVFVGVSQCALLGSKKCTYGPSYWCSHIHHAKDCNALQHCMTTVWKKQLIGSTETCFDVVKVLDVVRKSSDADLLDQMALGCTGMPVEKRSVCKELMTHDQKEVYQLLKSDLSSPNLAAALNLCGGFQDTVPHPGKVSGDYCKDCVNFFGDLREIFNNSEGQAVALVKSLVCSKLGPVEDLCDSLVDQYANMIFNIIYQQLNPDDICSLLQMCANQTHADLLRSVEYLLAKRQRSVVTCDLCQSLAKEIQDALRDTALQTEIMNALENDVCPLLPGNLSTQCKTYVAEYGPLVFQVLVAELDPKTICQTIGFCNATKTESRLTSVPRISSPDGLVHILAPEHKDKVASPQCTVCEFVMKKLEQLIGNNATEAEIMAALDKVCSLLPSTLSTECNDFVNEYGPVILELLLHDLAPEVVCATLGLCVVSEPQLVKHQVPVKSGKWCLDCEEVMGFVQLALENPSVQQSIMQGIEEVCDLVPASYKALCNQLIKEYEPTLFNLLKQYLVPAKICADLGLCTNGSKTASNESQSKPLKFQPMLSLQPAQPHRLGSEKCTYGPSYWCASQENAKVCNAEEHCAKYYPEKFGH